MSLSKERKAQEENRRKRLAVEQAMERRRRAARAKRDKNWAGKGFGKRNKESST